MSQPRDEAVSISRGIAILLMVLCHAAVVHGYVQDCIYLFHMPLFFVMSGMCFKDKYLAKPIEFAKRKIIGIYLPTVLIGLFFLSFHNVFYRMHIYNDLYGYAGNVCYLYSNGDYIKRLILLLFRLSSTEDMLGGYWFMYTLFFASFIYYISRKLVSNEYIVTALLLLASFFLTLRHWRIPYLLVGGREFLAASMISMGHVLKVQVEGRLRVLWAGMGLALVLLGGYLWPSDMNNFTPMTLFLFVATAVSASFALYLSCSYLSKRTEKSQFGTMKSILAYAGDHSFSILTWHFLSFKIVSIIYIVTHNIEIEHLAEFPTIEGVGIEWRLSYFVVGVMIPLLIARLYGFIKQSYHENYSDPIHI